MLVGDLMCYRDSLGATGTNMRCYCDILTAPGTRMMLLGHLKCYWGRYDSNEIIYVQSGNITC